MNPEVRKKMVEVVESLANSDNLGDVHDLAESYATELWGEAGAKAFYAAVDDLDTAALEALLIAEP